MPAWHEFAREAPDLAEGGRDLLFRIPIGLAYLCTLRRDGAPRIHPFCPVLADGRLYAFLGPSPKRDDLLRDPRCAVHAFPADKSDDEFYFAGTARAIHDPAVRAGATASYVTAGGKVEDHHMLFEFDLERALLAIYRYLGDWPPTYTKWNAAARR